MGQFKANRTVEGATHKLNFNGHIDEDAQFGSLELAGAAQVVLDLNEVSAINSCGIREWIKWIRTAPSGAKVIYKNCPKVIVDQINMVAGFLPENGKVESFYVPYYSDSTGNEKMILFREGSEFRNGEVYPPEEVKDEETGEAMEMDVIEAKYFRFLKG
jgi:hypothetical protein